MFKKVSTKALVGIFFILLFIVFLVNYKDKQKGDRTFKKEIAAIDSSKVTSIILLPKGDRTEDLVLLKTDNGWEVTMGEKRANADKDNVKNMILQLSGLEAKRVAATTSEKWKTFEVDDSSGTRVQAFEDDNKLIDLVIGKFSFQQGSQRATTYIRVYGEELVYAVEGMLNFTFNQKFQQLRDRTVIKGDVSQWTLLDFTYPHNNGFTLSKVSGKWLINGMVADSLNTMKYLNRISLLASTNLIDGMDKIPDEMASHKLRIEGDNLPVPIEVMAFPADSINKFFISTSINPSVYFSGGKSHLFEDIFFSPDHFYPKSAEVSD